MIRNFVQFWASPLVLELALQLIKRNVNKLKFCATPCAPSQWNLKKLYLRKRVSSFFMGAERYPHEKISNGLICNHIYSFTQYLSYQQLYSVVLYPLLLWYYLPLSVKWTYTQPDCKQEMLYNTCDISGEKETCNWKEN